MENLGKVHSTLPRPPPLLATHFARLRSRYRLIDDYNNDRLLYIHRASLPPPSPSPLPPLSLGSISLETDRIERSHAHYSNLVLPYEKYTKYTFRILYISLCIRTEPSQPKTSYSPLSEYFHFLLTRRMSNFYLFTYSLILTSPSTIDLRSLCGIRHCSFIAYRYIRYARSRIKEIRTG